jgi:threonine aldolase
MRKQVGGGMRQAGILAAACLVALDEMVDRLAEDHANARMLAQGLAAIDGVLLDPALVQTNIIYFDLDPARMDAPSLSAALAQRGVLINPTGSQRLRAVTNYQVSATDVETVLGAIEDVLAGDERVVGGPTTMLYR